MRKRSWRASRVLLWTCFAFLVCMSLGLSGVAWWTRVDAVEDTETAAIEASRLMAAHVERLFEASDLLLLHVADVALSTDLARPDSVSEAERRLAMLAATRPYVKSLHVVDAAGYARLQSTSGPLPTVNFADRDYFIAHEIADSSLYISAPLLSRVSGREIVILSRRISAPDGSFRGIAAMGLVPSYFDEFFRSLKLPPDSALQIVRPDMSLLVRKPPLSAEAMLDARVHPVTEAEIAANSFGTVTYASQFDGIERIWSYRRLEGYPLYVNVGFSPRAVLEQSNAMLRPLMLLAIAGLLALSLLSYVAWRRARGEEFMRVELEHANAELENRVRDRTEALASAVARLETALRQKELLFREVNHRVKNSLQMISGLLTLQAANIVDPTARRHFAEASGRVGMIAQVHKRLYQSEKVDTVDLAGYLGDLGVELQRSFGGPNELTVHSEPIDLSTDEAIPLALIVNELVTNAFKYAYPGGGGAVRVRCFGVADGALALEVADDGVGLPSDFDPAESRGLGMKLVRALVQQLEGELRVDRSGRGARFTIRMPFLWRSGA